MLRHLLTCSAAAALIAGPTWAQTVTVDPVAVADGLTTFNTVIDAINSFDDGSATLGPVGVNSGLDATNGVANQAAPNIIDIVAFGPYDETWINFGNGTFAGLVDGVEGLTITGANLGAGNRPLILLNDTGSSGSGFNVSGGFVLTLDNIILASSDTVAQVSDDMSLVLDNDTILNFTNSVLTALDPSATTAYSTYTQESDLPSDLIDGSRATDGTVVRTLDNGFFVGGFGSTHTSVCNITNSVITQMGADTLVLYGDATTNITNSTLSSGTRWAIQSGNNHNVVVDGSSIVTHDGIGIRAFSFGSMDLQNSNISNNALVGIFLQDDGVGAITLDGLTVCNNGTWGMQVFSDAIAVGTISNSLFWGNGSAGAETLIGVTPYFDGGNLETLADTGTIDIVGSTFGGAQTDGITTLEAQNIVVGRPEGTDDSVAPLSVVDSIIAGPGIGIDHVDAGVGGTATVDFSSLVTAGPWALSTATTGASVTVTNTINDDPAFASTDKNNPRAFNVHAAAYGGAATAGADLSGWGEFVGSTVVINEFVYDTDGGDAGEFVELYDGGATTDISGYRLQLVNGFNGVAYNEITIPGGTTLADGYHVIGNAATIDGIFGASTVDQDVNLDNGLQNGHDGIVLRLPSPSRNVAFTDVLDVTVDTLATTFSGDYDPVADKFLTGHAASIRVHNGTTGAYENDLDLTGITPGGLGFFGLTVAPDGHIYAYENGNSDVWHWTSVTDTAPSIAYTGAAFARTGHAVGTGASTVVAFTGAADFGNVEFLETADGITFTLRELVDLDSKSALAGGGATISTIFSVGSTGTNPLVKFVETAPLTWAAAAGWAPSVPGGGPMAYDETNDVLFVLNQPSGGPMNAFDGTTGETIGTDVVANPPFATTGYNGGHVDAIAGSGTVWTVCRGATTFATFHKWTYTVSGILPATGAVVDAVFYEGDEVSDTATALSAEAESEGATGRVADGGTVATFAGKSRLPNGVDTNNNFFDFANTFGSPGAANVSNPAFGPDTFDVAVGAEWQGAFVLPRALDPTVDGLPASAQGGLAMQVADASGGGDVAYVGADASVLTITGEIYIPPDAASIPVTGAWSTGVGIFTRSEATWFSSFLNNGIENGIYLEYQNGAGVGLKGGAVPDAPGEIRVLAVDGAASVLTDSITTTNVTVLGTLTVPNGLKGTFVPFTLSGDPGGDTCYGALNGVTVYNGTFPASVTTTNGGGVVVGYRENFSEAITGALQTWVDNITVTNVAEVAGVESWLEY